MNSPTAIIIIIIIIIITITIDIKSYSARLLLDPLWVGSDQFRVGRCKSKK